MSNSPEKKHGFRLKAVDFVIMGMVVLLSFSTTLFMHQTGEYVSITWQGIEIYSGALANDELITTPDGLNTIIISNRTVRMEGAECPDMACVRMGIASPSQPIICLPNQVIVTVTADGGVDSVTW